MSEQELAALEGAADEAVLPEGIDHEAPEAAENTEGQAPEGQPAEGEDESPEEKTATQKRRERRKAQEQRLREEAKAAAKKAEEAEARLKLAKDPAKAGQPPREEDFSHDPVSYAVELALHKQAQARTDAEVSAAEAELSQARQAQENAANQRRASLEQEYVAQLEGARKTYADYDQVISAAPITDEVASLILESDAPTDLAYYLGKHLEEARAISAMDPVAAARRLGQIEAKLAPPQPKLKSNAPDPITPVKPGGSAAKNWEKMTPEEFAAWREAGGTP